MANERRSFKDALAEITGGISRAQDEIRKPTYTPQKTDSQLLNETASMAESTRKIVTGMSIEMDVHLALHWLYGAYTDVSPTIMGSPELFIVLCKARSARLESVEEVSVTELHDWCETEMIEIINEHKDLWEESEK